MASCCECVKKDMARASSLYERLRGFPESADKDAPSRGDIAVQATIHNCAESFQNAVNVEAIQPTLSQANVLRLGSDRHLLRIRKPDNPGAENNNLRVMLSRFSGERFEEFLEALRVSGIEYKPHKELYDEMIVEYNRIKNDPVAAEKAAHDLFSDPQFDRFISPNPWKKKRCQCDWCIKQWKLWVFLPFLIISSVVTGLLLLASYFSLHSYAQGPLESIQPTPSLISGSSDVIIDLRSNSTFTRSATITTNCTGSVYMKEHSDCSGLKKMTIFETLRLYSPVVHYLLSGSWVYMDYDGNYGKKIVIIKSLEGYSRYKDLCWNISHRECQYSENDVVNFICSNGSEDFFKCYESSKTNRYFNITVNETEFYFFVFQFPPPTRYDLCSVNYNRSMFDQEGFSPSNLTLDESSGEYKATILLPGHWWSHRPDNCIILSTDCPSKTRSYYVHYKLNFENNFYISLYIPLAALGAAVLTILIVVQLCCYYRRWHSLKGSSVEDTEIVTFASTNEGRAGPISPTKH